MVAYTLAALGLFYLFADVHGRQLSVPVKSHLKALRPITPGSTIALTLALPSTNMPGLHAALLDVSDPASANYGKWLSKSEVEAFVAPTAETVKAVNDWLAQHGLTSEKVSPAGELIRVKIPVQTANAWLSANFTEFEDTRTSQTINGTLSYTIPDEVNEHIKFIYPTTQFIPSVAHAKPVVQVVQPPKSQLAKKATAPSACSSQIYPECLFDLYNMPNTTTSTAGNSLAIAGYLSEIPSINDLAEFYSQWRPGVSVPGYTVESIDGGVTSGTGTVEASLDLQYTLGLASGIPTTFVSDGDPYSDGFVDMANALLSQEDPPLVLSVSYGFNEASFEGAQDVANQFCDTYAQLGARGTSVLFCSGDNGVYSFSYDSTCDATTFGPTFPSGCPYLTSVGGTEGIPETSASFSGGGFSNIFARPSYQDSAVSSYLSQLGSTNAGLYNSSGRAFPDVSAQSVDFWVCIASEWYWVLGTSASTPTFATVVALLNDRRLAAGLSPLGFLNPLLYSSAASALNDITTGSNPGCGAQGFPALAGWDPVTGLGTPDYNKLLSVVMSV